MVESVIAVVVIYHTKEDFFSLRFGAFFSFSLAPLGLLNYVFGMVIDLIIYFYLTFNQVSYKMQPSEAQQ